MMTRQQREAAYAAVQLLRTHVGARYADAMSQALSDLHEYETGQRALTEYAKVNGEWRGQSTSSEPEIYTYWIGTSYVKNNVTFQCGVEVRRTTPILTREDVLMQADLIAADQGWSQCSILGIFPIVNED